MDGLLPGDIRCLFFSQFHPITGPMISCQVLSYLCIYLDTVAIAITATISIPTCCETKEVSISESIIIGNFI